MRLLVGLSLAALLTAATVPEQPGYAATADKPFVNWTEKERIGCDVPIVSWRNDTVAPWAILLCLHGLSLHASSYDGFAKRISDLGIPTYAIDLRGFGSWQKTQTCDRVDFNAAFQDIHSALQAIRKANPNLPVVLLGESMGGALALQAASDYPDLVDALICAVPAKTRNGQKSTTIKTAVGLFSARNKPISVGTSLVQEATKQPEVQMEWEHDPLSRLNLTPLELLAFQKMMNQNAVKAEKLADMPVLFLQGVQDRLIKPAGTADLFKRLKTPDKSMVMVGCTEHLVFEQGQFNDQIIDLISSWMDRNVVKSIAFSGPGCANPNDLASNKTSDSGNDDRIREALGHLRIAQGNLLLNNYSQARDELISTIRIGHGTNLAVQADKLLLTLPDKFIAPATGAATRSKMETVSLAAAKANDKPTILVFCASWIQACSSLADDVNNSLGTYADKVNMVTIDADEPKNQAVLDEYGVKPLPAILYLTSTNEVMFYTLGKPGPSAVLAKVKQLFAEEAKLSKAGTEN